MKERYVGEVLVRAAGSQPEDDDKFIVLFSCVLD